MRCVGGHGGRGAGKSAGASGLSETIRFGSPPSRDAAEELCFSRLEELPWGPVAAGGLPLDGDIAQRRRWARQLTFRF